ncbi:glutamate-1-semialdehyde 2,1-aminomutase [Candidatus Phycosocius bacilliformis]|uniref:Glutamate-1-semialdehyde 2,1-aminomutase n=1 Tax=Candidatus Phycosocius bacilliformis TaxID=1445552 RepID=A0A2P2E705_9PROT|nr:transaminase [Candidatus Phycosocius bacilliformis]GBF56842.1 glutamate-1-semialdehyde 2,1-aminomutase [Candidatus Phycosocius bacilliformis]
MSIDREKLAEFKARESDAFRRSRPLSAARARHDNGFFGGVPQHWMLDWPMPFPLVVASASGTTLLDLDGHELTDLCLGDTGAMFGHNPAPVAKAVAAQAAHGLTAMLPSADVEAVGDLLRSRFGLPYWQITLTASDANRFALRAARAITGRKRILVFDGCYHGAVDETAVNLINGRTEAKPSLWGQAYDLADVSVCVPFNDVDALAKALAREDIACVITEPALTNCGIVAPQPGFLEDVRRLTRSHGSLLLIDETHTLSTGPGGWTGTFGLEPDIFVAGKAVAGGIPTGIWGFNEAVKAGIERIRRDIPPGHSGVGTTLSGSPLQMAALRACLGEVMTETTYAGMIASAIGLEDALNTLIKVRGLPWSVIRLGARLETVFAPDLPTNAVEMRASFDHDLEAAIHLGLLNRGFLVTPFHNMLLAGPGLPQSVPQAYVSALDSILDEIL